MTDFAAVVTAFGGLIAAVTGLILALTPLINRAPASVKDDDKASVGQPSQPAQPTPEGSVKFDHRRTQVSRRTTLSLACGVVAASMAVILVLTNGSGQSGQHVALDLTLLALVGVLALSGGTLGVERAWEALTRTEDRPLALNAALGVVVSLASWVSALTVTSALW